MICGDKRNRNSKTYECQRKQNYCEAKWKRDKNHSMFVCLSLHLIWVVERQPLRKKEEERIEAHTAKQKKRNLFCEQIAFYFFWFFSECFYIFFIVPKKYADKSKLLSLVKLLRPHNEWKLKLNKKKFTPQVNTDVCMVAHLDAYFYIVSLPISVNDFSKNLFLCCKLSFWNTFAMRSNVTNIK